jgi:acetyl esterase/lipase
MVHVSGFDLPLSSYMSEEAKRRFIDKRHEAPLNDPGAAVPIEKVRETVDEVYRKKVEQLQTAYPVLIAERKIGGVTVHSVAPKDGVASHNRDRLLINLHGGGFEVGAVWLGLTESIPIASVARITVIAVDYRMAPEYQFPAASEDVASVYHELLRHYRAENIGIYGCSAGGSLAAMVAAWLQKQNEPNPGAIGIFSAGAFAGFATDPSNRGSWGGDSRFVAPLLAGKKTGSVASIRYLRNVALDDPLVSPGVSPEVLAKFPPTLLITGTRAYDMSAAVQTQRELTKAGVDADLHVWDGMGHCFFLDQSLPESKEAYAVIGKFFDRRLGGVDHSTNTVLNHPQPTAPVGLAPEVVARSHP